MQRREFFKKSFAAASALALADTLGASETRQPIDNRKVSSIAFPEKRPLITYSDRPPLLESPRETFSRAITPNDEFFVRWHMPEIPTHIDPATYKIHINGAVERELHISLDSLKLDFEQVEVTAVLQCGGNSRSAFTPTAGGIQWGHGAMGCAKWKGVRLRDLLSRAGLKKDAAWIGFNGLDNAAYYETPNFVREMPLEDLDDHVIVAYEMNGEDLPYLNGYPLRLVIPGHYSDSWVKMLSNITVTTEYQKLFFMDVAYRVPDNDCECETPENRFKPTKPITTMNVKSIIGYPTNNTIVHHNTHLVVRGVAFDDGHGIRDVLISTDGGKTWGTALLDKDAGRYAFRAFRYAIKPTKMGKLTIMAKAINRLGAEQPFAHEIKWNHGGYKFNGIDAVTVEVI
ncbi:MAG: molybdopterin-dependent oxidoreductase [Campylobacterales bacterium]|nr:molybdopterin-dependent oxidoreductase [Campylobacterales bacterium]